MLARTAPPGYKASTSAPPPLMDFDRFLDEFWDDADRDQVRPLVEYQARYPACASAIAQEYALYDAVRAGAGKTASDDSRAIRPRTAAAATPLAPEVEGRFLAILDTPQEQHAAQLAALCAAHVGQADALRAWYDEWRASAQRSRDRRGREELGATAPLPTRLGRYEVLGPLSQGGMGTLLRARDPELGREVVLKTVRPALGADRHALARFRREARIAGRLGHPHLCPVLDVIHEDDRIWVVMPLLRGATLDQTIDRARAQHDHASPPWSRLDLGAADPVAAPSATGKTEIGGLPAVLLFMERVARAMHDAHETGIVHRDLKPSNVMVQPDGSPVVFDFGLATRSDEETSLTLPGQVMGTPAYMAPEQIDGRPDAIDRRTDVYALGVILYELLTLARPFEGANLAALFAAIRRGQPTLPRRHAPTLRRDLEAVCLRAMAPERDRRYLTADDFARDLANVRLLRPTAAKPLTVATRLVRWGRRNPMAVALVTAVGLAGGMWYWADRAQAAAIAMAPQARVGRLAMLKRELLGLTAIETDNATVFSFGPAPRILQYDRPSDERSARSMRAFAGKAVTLLDRLREVGLSLDDDAGTGAPALEGLAADEAELVWTGVFTFAEHACLSGALGVVADRPTQERAAALEPAARIANAWRRLGELLARHPALRVGAATVKAAEAWFTRLEDQVAPLVESRPSMTAAEAEFLSWLVNLVPSCRSKSLDVTVNALDQHWGSFWLHHRRGRLAYHSAAPRLDDTDRRRELDTAIYHFEIARALNPRSPSVLNNLGLAYEMAGQRERASAILLRALALDPGYVPALTNLGASHRDAKEFAEAERYFRRAFTLSPSDVTLALVLGLTVRDQAENPGHGVRFDEALALFRTASELAPANWEGPFRLGETLQMLGQHEAAITACEEGVRRYPKGIDPHVTKAESLWALDRHREALELLLSLVKLRPDAKAGFGLLADFLDECGDQALVTEIRARLQAITAGK